MRKIDKNTIFVLLGVILFAASIITINLTQYQNSSFNTINKNQTHPNNTEPQLPKDPEGNGCSMIYLDLGTNIGIQIRKVYEPELYINSLILPYFDTFFGRDLEVRRAVCSFGFEPNPGHTPYLKYTEESYKKLGYNVKIFTETAVGDFDGEASLVIEDSSRESNHMDWGAKIGDSVEGKKTKAVRMLNFPKWFKENIADRNYTGQSAIVMKVDIEGFEYTIFPYLIRNGLYCLIDFVYVEHVNWDIMRELNDVMQYSGCKTRMMYIDDESYFNMPFPFPHEMD
eukprot:TRINITY_DN18140_c0_g1_i1.p1 TRINITY_DN18140_c0_g1~~TRINITY_DN18140_c0_g1_i1.p1  ORF type:complete len:284 (-),score=25.20 TRINITY_DN18140_c0_g1_i1:138-989(-)